MFKEPNELKEEVIKPIEEIIPPDDIERLEVIIDEALIETENKKEDIKMEDKQQNYNHNNRVIQQFIDLKLLFADVITGISVKRQEQITDASSLKTEIIIVKNRMGKYLFVNFLLGCLLSFILGGVANENKQMVYPIIQKSYNFLSNMKFPGGN